STARVAPAPHARAHAVATAIAPREETAGAHRGRSPIRTPTTMAASAAEMATHTLALPSHAPRPLTERRAGRLPRALVRGRRAHRGRGGQRAARTTFERRGAAAGTTVAKRPAHTRLSARQSQSSR